MSHLAAAFDAVIGGRVISRCHVRYATVNGHPVNEIRAGLSFAFKEEGDTTPLKPGVTSGNWGLSR
jgi:hypothetical protein